MKNKDSAALTGFMLVTLTKTAGLLITNTPAEEARGRKSTKKKKEKQKEVRPVRVT